MASSNRHWPSMFKSKPCNTHHHQWQHDINPSSLMSSTCQRSSFNSSGGGGGGVSGEERSPEPKPRWNPKPEQIRILEAIFNSGMVNPPRDEIRKIRAQLQEYGQVGDANVFYWFQNRKSRSKHKQKHHHHHNLQSQHKTQLLSSSSLVSITNTASAVAPTLLAPLHQTSSSSSSSSSESKTSPKGTTHDHHENKNITSSSTSESLLGSLMSSMSSSGNSFFNVSHDVSNSPLHQTSSSSHHAGFLSSSSSSTSHLHEQFFFPTSTTTSTSGVQNNFAVFPHHGLGFSAPTDPSSLDVLHHDHQVISSGPSHGLLLSEILMMNHQNGSKRILDRQDHDHQLLMMNYSSIDANTSTATTPNGHNASMFSPTPTTATATTTHARFDVNPIQGVALMGAPADAPRLTVFINDVAFEVSVGPFNVREAFGDDALLIHSSGQPVLTNDWGVTLQSLQPGASYYLVI